MCGQCLSRGHEAPVGVALAISQHVSVCSSNSLSRHTEIPRGGFHQQRSRIGSHLTQLLIVRPDRSATTGHLNARAGNAVIGMHARKGHVQINWIVIQLLADQGTETGGNPLAHLVAGAIEANDVVRGYLQECVGHQATFGFFDWQRGARTTR